MYYLVIGYVKDKTTGDYDGSFDWILEAESEEAAKAQLEENEILEEIREISVEERIEREEKVLFEAIKNEYLMRRLGDCTVREYANKQREMRTNPEMYYKALVEYNKMHRLIKRLHRRNGFDKITVAQFFDLVNKLIDAETEEEFNAILHSVD